MDASPLGGKGPMSGLMRLIAGNPKPTKIAGFQVQTSVYGKPIPIVYGFTRLAGNLIHMPAQPVLKNTNQSKASRATKGAAGGEIYVAPIMIGLCEGPIQGIATVWRDKDGGVDFTTEYVGHEGWTISLGASAPAVWSFLSANYPLEAVPYQFLAWVANPSVPMPSGSLSQYSFMIEGFLRNFLAFSSQYASPADVIPDFLTAANYGAGFSSAQIGDLTQAQNYCAAAGLLFGPAVDEQKPGADWVNEFCEVGNLALVWSDGKLKLIPYGDVSLSGLGHTYTPNTTPIYDLTDADFLPPSGDLDPIQVTRSDPATAVNQVTVEYIDEISNFNVNTYTAQDQYAIQQYGVINLTLTLHSIHQGAVAQQVAQMRLQREQNVRNTYAFRLGWRFALLEPMDLVTLTDIGLGLNKTPVRITQITENGDESGFDVVAEEWPFGTASATLYATPNPLGGAANANVAPGSTNTPTIVEVPGPLKTSPLDLFIAASGGATWGGADVWISTDNVNFNKVGRIIGAAAMGTLTSTLPSTSTIWPTFDTGDTLAVDISASGRTLSSYSATDTTNLVPACYVDGEWVAFENATLTSPGHYNLTTLYRGLFNSAAASHGVGAKFFLVDASVARIPWPQGFTGQTLYVKLPAFNIYGAALEDIAAVASFSYTIGNDPTRFQNAIPQGTVALDQFGNWSVTFDLPTNAVSCKYIAQVGSFASDAAVIAGGTVANGTPVSLSGGPLGPGAELFVTIVPYSATGATGQVLPSAHLRSVTYQPNNALGAVTVGKDGTWSATIDLPQSAQSCRYAISTSALPSDASTAASGTIFTGAQLVLSGTLTPTQVVYITVVPFTGTGASGSALPASHFLSQAYVPGIAQGAVQIATDGTWSLVADLPQAAASAKYITSTSNFPSDAAVIAGGAGIGSSPIQITGGPLAVGQWVYITIVPYTGAGQTGQTLPSLHIQSSQYLPSVPQGTVSVSIDGSYFALIDLPPNAASYKFATSTVNFPSDATALANTAVNGSGAISITGTLAPASRIFITIIPFTGAAGTGTQLPTGHVSSDMFAPVNPQGTVSVGGNGGWSFTVDGPQGAQSCKWLASTSSYPSDASVTSGGTLVSPPGPLWTGTSASSFGALAFGQTVFVTIVPYTGASAGGVALPSIHLQGTYLTYTPSKTAYYSAAGFAPDYPNSSAAIYQASDGSMHPAISMGGGTLEDFSLTPALPNGVQITNVSFISYWSSGIPEGRVEVFFDRINGTTRTNLANALTSNVGWQTLSLSLNESTTGNSYRAHVQFQGPASTTEIAQAGVFITYTAADPSTTL